MQVIVVDHDKDSGLCSIDELAAEAVSNAIKFGAEACVHVSLSFCCWTSAASYFTPDFCMSR